MAEESSHVPINHTPDRLTGRTLAEPRQQKLIAALRERVDVRLAELKRAIAARRAGGFDAARQSVSTNHGRQLMLEMRSLVGEMQSQKQTSLTQAAAESRRSAVVTRVGDFVGAGLGIGLVCLAFYL